MLNPHAYPAGPSQLRHPRPLEKVTNHACRAQGGRPGLPKTPKWIARYGPAAVCVQWYGMRTRQTSIERTSRFAPQWRHTCCSLTRVTPTPVKPIRTTQIAMRTPITPERRTQVPSSFVGAVSPIGCLSLCPIRARPPRPAPPTRLRPPWRTGPAPHPHSLCATQYFAISRPFVLQKSINFFALPRSRRPSIWPQRRRPVPRLGAHGAWGERRGKAGLKENDKQGQPSDCLGS